MQNTSKLFLNTPLNSVVNYNTCNESKKAGTATEILTSFFEKYNHDLTLTTKKYLQSLKIIIVITSILTIVYCIVCYLLFRLFPQIDKKLIVPLTIILLLLVMIICVLHHKKNEIDTKYNQLTGKNLIVPKDNKNSSNQTNNDEATPPILPNWIDDDPNNRNIILY